MREARPERSAGRRQSYAALKRVVLVLACAGCAVDERTLLTSGAVSGSGSAGNGSSNGGQSSEGGSAGEAPLPRCNYLGTALEDGCETLVTNPGFSLNVAGWTAENVGILEGWVAVDASQSDGSGALVVTNSNYSAEDAAKLGVATGAARQCVAIVSGRAYGVAADVFIPKDQGEGHEQSYISSAALSLFFYPLADCAGQTVGSFTSDAVQVAGEWQHLEGLPNVPKEALSMAVRLATLKPFPQYKFEAYYDNVLVKER